MSYLWTTVLYSPLVNILMFLYERFAFGNLGLAVVELTVALRVILLPLSILSERNALAYERLEKKITAIESETKNDSVRRRERIRELLREAGVSPWAKVTVLGVQLLVLILLYQVFLGGINFSKFTHLYPWVAAPDYINLTFLGFRIDHRSYIWPGFVAVLLFIEITLAQRRASGDVTRNDQWFRVLFPASVFVALWALPMVKSIFILTSMFFGFLLTGTRRVVFPVQPHNGKVTTS